MTIALSTLAARLASMVPARNSIPSSGDYDQHVKDAVLQLGQDAPLLRTATLSIVSGTVTYTLAADFLYMVEVVKPLKYDDVLVTNAGLVPVAAEYNEMWDYYGNTLTITPTPTYTTDRRYRYAALHALNGSNEYTTLDDNRARVALLYAQYLAIGQLANAESGTGWRYQIGDEMVDKKGAHADTRNQADAMLKSYQQAVKLLKGIGR